MTHPRTYKRPVEEVAEAIARATSERRYGLYNFNHQSHAVLPHLVRDERSGETLLRTIDAAAAAAFYESLVRKLPAVVALDWLRSAGFINDIGLESIKAEEEEATKK